MCVKQCVHFWTCHSPLCLQCATTFSLLATSDSLIENHFSDLHQTMNVISTAQISSSGHCKTARTREMFAMMVHTVRINGAQSGTSHSGLTSWEHAVRWRQVMMNAGGGWRWMLIKVTQREDGRCLSWPRLALRQATASRGNQHRCREIHHVPCDERGNWWKDGVFPLEPLLFHSSDSGATAEILEDI